MGTPEEKRAPGIEKGWGGGAEAGARVSAAKGGSGGKERTRGGNRGGADGATTREARQKERPSRKAQTAKEREREGGQAGERGRSCGGEKRTAGIPVSQGDGQTGAQMKEAKKAGRRRDEPEQQAGREAWMKRAGKPRAKGRQKGRRRERVGEAWVSGGKKSRPEKGPGDRVEGRARPRGRG